MLDHHLESEICCFEDLLKVDRVHESECLPFSLLFATQVIIGEMNSIISPFLAPCKLMSFFLWSLGCCRSLQTGLLLLQFKPAPQLTETDPKRSPKAFDRNAIGAPVFQHRVDFGF